MNRDGYSPPSHMYYETIRQGYRDFNLDPTNLIQARDSFPNHMHKQDIWRSKQWG